MSKARLRLFGHVKWRCERLTITDVKRGKRYTKKILRGGHKIIFTEDMT